MTVSPQRTRRRLSRATAPLVALGLLVSPHAGARSCNPPRITVARDETVTTMPRFDPANASTLSPTPAGSGTVGQFTDSDWGNHYVRDAVVDPANRNRLYIANADTVQRSDDGGCTWREVYHLPHLGTDPAAATAETSRLTQIVVTKPAVYLVAMPFHSGNGVEAIPGERLHVLRSTDGKTFSAADTGIPPLPGFARMSALPDGKALYLDVLPFDARTSDYSASAVLYRSTDGRTWTQASGQAPGPDLCCWIDPAKPGDLWATVPDPAADTTTTATAIAHSTDGGATFATVRPADAAASYQVLGLSHRPGRPLRLLLAGRATGVPGFYAVTDDGGKHVTRLAPLPTGYTPYVAGSLDDPYGYNGLNYGVFGARDDQLVTLAYKTGPAGTCYLALSYDGRRAQQWRQLTTFLDPSATTDAYCQPTILLTAPGQGVVRYLQPDWTGQANVQFLVTYGGRW
jgi:hypothetical protein